MKMFIMHVPYRDNVEDISFHGFDKVSVTEDEDNPDEVYFEYSVGSTVQVGLGEYYKVKVNLKRNTVTGTGSRSHRDEIDNVVSWYKKALEDEEIAKEIFVCRD